MTPALAWVLGRGGLIGSAVARHVPAELPGVTLWPEAAPAFPWRDPSRLPAALGEAAEAFGRRVRAEERAWLVLWLGGTGVVATAPEVLAEETRTLGRVLALTARHLADAAPERPGLVLLASSAGGVYAGGAEQPFTEASPCRPISEYGRNKLRQETLVTEWAASRAGVACLVARLANIYGPGQDLSKPQGLIPHLVMRLIRREPLPIWVPLDARRDYLYVEDLARQLLRCVDHVRRRPGPPGVVKIFASGRSVTVAHLLGLLARVARRRPQVVVARRPAGSEQPRALAFRSTVLAEVAGPAATGLLDGIHRVFQHQLRLHGAGRPGAP